jgi:hypothetical protein
MYVAIGQACRPLTKWDFFFTLAASHSCNFDTRFPLQSQWILVCFTPPDAVVVRDSPLLVSRCGPLIFWTPTSTLRFNVASLCSSRDSLVSPHSVSLVCTSRSSRLTPTLTPVIKALCCALLVSSQTLLCLLARSALFHARYWTWYRSTLLLTLARRCLVSSGLSIVASPRVGSIASARS